MLPGATRSPTAPPSTSYEPSPAHRQPVTDDGAPAALRSLRADGGLRSSQPLRREGSLRDTLLKKPLSSLYDNRD
jgi:hypothetical protein